MNKMNRYILKYLVVAVVVVIALSGCEPEKVIEPCEREGTGILKLINKSPLRFTVKIDGKNMGQIAARDVKEYVLRGDEYYVCIELSNAICYKEYTIDIVPCEKLTIEMNN